MRHQVEKGDLVNCQIELQLENFDQKSISDGPRSRSLSSVQLQLQLLPTCLVFHTTAYWNPTGNSEWIVYLRTRCKLRAWNNHPRYLCGKVASINTPALISESTIRNVATSSRVFGLFVCNNNRFVRYTRHPHEDFIWMSHQFFPWRVKSCREASLCDGKRGVRDVGWLTSALSWGSDNLTIYFSASSFSSSSMQASTNGL